MQCDITNITEKLKSNGEKMTPARRAIIKVLSFSNHLLSVGEIYEELRKQDIGVNYSTVYRNLDVLSKNEVIEKINFADGAKFKLLRTDKHLHHLICLSCHNTEVLNYCPYQDLEKIIKSNTKFQPLEHKLEIYGYCEECQKKNRD